MWFPRDTNSYVVPKSLSSAGFLALYSTSPACLIGSPSNLATMGKNECNLNSPSWRIYVLVSAVFWGVFFVDFSKGLHKENVFPQNFDIGQVAVLNRGL